ncbi:HU family DNA-binding protein [Methylocystis bryophila]|uniref:HU family DNA-binding protein n=1 Tax=Methylocystis bryophila TaxID=655015 RepID=UPI000A267082|nr:HU family DNA-binding protein [Methylocystis bryophila]
MIRENTHRKTLSTLAEFAVAGAEGARCSARERRASPTHRNNAVSGTCADARGTSKTHSQTLTRSDIAAAIKKRVPKLSRREATRLLDCVLQEIAEALLQGEECVKLHEFGTFFARERAARRGRNPRTGETAVLPRRKALNFRPSTALKERINGV